MNKHTNHLLNNHIIEALDPEHGKKVIEFWKSQGIDTHFSGINTKSNNSDYRFYGLSNNKFDNYTIHINSQCKIITLEEAIKLTQSNPLVCDNVTYFNPPIEMWVGVSQKEVDNQINKRFVFMSKTIDDVTYYYAWANALTVEQIKNADYVRTWEFGTLVNKPKQTTYTKQEIAELLGITPDDLVIR